MTDKFNPTHVGKTTKTPVQVVYSSPVWTVYLFKRPDALNGRERVLLTDIFNRSYEEIVPETVHYANIYPSNRSTYWRSTIKDCIQLSSSKEPSIGILERRTKHFKTGPVHTLKVIEISED